MLDGELVIRGDDGEVKFDALQMRIHPAESRIKLLSGELPAEMVVFDLLAEGRRGPARPPALRAARAARAAGGKAGLTVSQLVRDPEDAEKWLQSAEGVIAKDLNAIYEPG